MDLTHAILHFLIASPLTLFVGSPDTAPEWVAFIEDIFNALSTYLVVDDARTRDLANVAAQKIMIDGTRALFQKSKALGSRTFKYNFWKTTSVTIPQSPYTVQAPR